MVINENLIEKYNNLKENLADLLLLRENIISIRDDLLLDDQYKVKLLYKKNIENLIVIQKNLERDIINLLRAGEILKHLEFSGNFVNLTQVFNALRDEKFVSDEFSESKNINFVMDKYFSDLDDYEDSKSDKVFKEIAKEIYTQVNFDENFSQKDLWKETLKAKSDNNQKSLKNILNTINSKNKKENFDLDFLCSDIAKIEESLRLVNKEITEITKVCKENFDDDKLEEISYILKNIEEKQKELKRSISTLSVMRKSMIDGFLGMLPANRNNILN